MKRYKGGTGTLGSEIVGIFAEKGHQVRATAQDRTSADRWVKYHPELIKRVEFVIVPEIAVPGCLDDAVKGVKYIAHTAARIPVGVSVRDFTRLKRRDKLIMDRAI